MTDKTRVVVVSGMSGAGKSTALHALEDLGYFCIDNLPTSLVDQAVTVCEGGKILRIGLCIDMRVGSFLDSAAQTIRSLARPDRDVVVLFLDASDVALLRRFSETRRPHPLSAVSSGESQAAGTLAVLDGIHLERQRLSSLRALATIDLDTTMLSVHQLRRQIIEHLGPGKAAQPRMRTRFVSFGYKYGVPVDADVIFDVRFLDNPYFVNELKELPGTDPKVRDFVLHNTEAFEFIRRAEELLSFTMPRHEREGKSYLTIGIGCTGGRHRSVVLATVLADRLRGVTELPILVVHRDIARAKGKEAGEPVSAKGSGEGHE